VIEINAVLKILLHNYLTKICQPSNYWRSLWKNNFHCDHWEVIIGKIAGVIASDPSGVMLQCIKLKRTLKLLFFKKKSKNHAELRQDQCNKVGKSKWEVLA